MQLEEIKDLVIEKYAEEVDLSELRLKIIGLEKEVSEALELLNKTDQKKYEEIKKNLSNESLSLIKTLVSFIS